MTWRRAVAAFSTAFALLAGTAFASGAVDPTFGDGGLVTTEFHHGVNEVRALALLADGRIVVAGRDGGDFNDTFLARYTADGELDPTFGDAGSLLDESTRGALGIAVQPDGKLVVVAEAGDVSDPDFSLLRYDADGTLDPGFGVGGRVLTNFSADSNDQANSVILQPDGRIVTAGYTGANNDPANFALARYLTDGTLDATFGTGGRAVTDFGALSADARALALQADGKIVAAGRVGDDFAVVRYLADGTPDSTFGTGGVVVTDFAGHPDYGRAVVVQADGKILVAGFAQVTAGDDDFALARYLADGSPDTGFGTGGLVTTDLGGLGGDYGHGLALQADGKIVVGGESGDEDFAAVRYLTDGTVDATFAGGAAVVDFGRASGRAVAVDGAGGILLAGHVEYDLAIARFLTDGSLDGDFGVAGLATIDLGISSDVLAGLTVQPDGRIVAVGRAGQVFADKAMALARYTADGQSDPSFGDGGRVLTVFAPGTTEGSAVAVQSDGKIVACGRTGWPNLDYALARYLADGSLDPGFGTGGRVTSDFGGESDFADDLAVQADGRIVAVGGLNKFKAARFNSDGTPDAGFGTGGQVTVSFGTGSSAKGVEVQPDGKLVLAGFAGAASNAKIALVRLNPDGTLDAGFGDGGTVIFDPPLPGGYFGWDLALQPDGKIVVAVIGTTLNDFAVMRFNGDGTPDVDFGTGGLLITDVGSGHSAESNGVAVQPDGTIVLAGTTPQSAGNQNVVVAHYLPDGELDPTFGDGGIALVDFGSFSERGTRVVFQPLKRLVVGGYRDADFMLVGITAGGLLFADGFESGDTSAWSATVP